MSGDFSSYWAAFFSCGKSVYRRVIKSKSKEETTLIERNISLGNLGTRLIPRCTGLQLPVVIHRSAKYR